MDPLIINYVFLMLVPQILFLVVVCLVWGLAFVLEYRRDICGDVLPRGRSVRSSRRIKASQNFRSSRRTKASGVPAEPKQTDAEHIIPPGGLCIASNTPGVHMSSSDEDASSELSERGRFIGAAFLDEDADILHGKRRERSRSGGELRELLGRELGPLDQIHDLLLGPLDLLLGHFFLLREGLDDKD